MLGWRRMELQELPIPQATNLCVCSSLLLSGPFVSLLIGCFVLKCAFHPDLKNTNRVVKCLQVKRQSKVEADMNGWLDRYDFDDFSFHMKHRNSETQTDELIWITIYLMCNVYFHLGLSCVILRISFQIL